MKIVRSEAERIESAKPQIELSGLSLKRDDQARK